MCVMGLGIHVDWHVWNCVVVVGCAFALNLLN